MVAWMAFSHQKDQSTVMQGWCMLKRRMSVDA